MINDLSLYSIRRGSELVSLACGDSEVTAAFRRLISEHAGIVATPALSKPLIRGILERLESLMFTAVADGKAIDSIDSYPLKHTFCGGLYVREISIPAGHIVMGKIHKYDHPHFITKGRVTIFSEENGIEELSAGCTMKSMAGIKRFLVTHEDTVWTTLHITDETVPEAAVDSLTVKNYSELGLEVCSLPQLSQPQPVMQGKLK